MIAVLSPAKTLDLQPDGQLDYTLPRFRKESQVLASILKGHSHKELKELMHISDKLTDLNFDRYQNFKKKETLKNAKQAIKAFKGDVYLGLKAEELNAKQLEFAQNHIRILSGLYGVLRPLDLMQPYRLEMGTKLKNDQGKDLYAFWQDKISKSLTKELKSSSHPLIINLASKEYFKSIQNNELKAEVINIEFREYKGDALKFISFNAKKARGMMARYIIDEKIKNPDLLKGFNYDGYAFDQNISSPSAWFFTR